LVEYDSGRAVCGQFHGGQAYRNDLAFFTIHLRSKEGPDAINSEKPFPAHLVASSEAYTANRTVSKQSVKERPFKAEACLDSTRIKEFSVCGR